jgi:hypothetical protein
MFWRSPIGSRPLLTPEGRIVLLVVVLGAAIFGLGLLTGLRW